MARAELPASLEELRNPQDIQSHINALKSLKHSLIGHEQRKELVIHHGVIPLLLRNLTAPCGSYAPEQELEVRLQTVQIVSCLAHGGLAFVTPLLASGILGRLVETLSPSSTPTRLVTESLRAVNAVAEALATDVLLAPETSGLSQFSTLLFARPTVDSLVEILAQRKDSTAINEQMTLVLKIISTCLREDDKGPHQSAIVKTGVLDLICCRLASLVAKNGMATQALDPSFVSSMLPAPPWSSLQCILEALAVLSHKSAYRSMRIVYSRHLLEVFPIASPHTTHTPGDYLSFSSEATPLPLSSNPIDHFLPKLQAVQSKNEHNFSKAFPALGSFSQHSDAGLSGTYFEGAHVPHTTTVSGRTISADEFGSPLIAWLIHVARHSTGLERLAALEFLAKLYAALDQKIMEGWTESSRNRDRTLAFLVVPLLVRVIDTADPRNAISARASNDEIAAIRLIRERAPLALSILIADAPALQRAAHDANAIHVFSQALKKSFDAVSAVRKPMWTSTPRGLDMDLTTEGDDPACTVGAAAMPAENTHRFRYRAASMEALAAIAARDDEYRKTVIESGVTSCLIDSLGPIPDATSAETENATGKDGNPTFTIVAACKLATALSRCVGVLRTKLLDAGLARPVLSLLSSPLYSLKSAGLDAATNLLLHFSPMREELIANGVIKVICGLAHSADADIKFGALWAVKNLCASAPKDVRMGILDELGTGWLVQVMSGEVGVEGAGLGGPRVHLAGTSAAGERVDLLNADEGEGGGMEVDGDEEMDGSSNEDEEDDDGEEREHGNELVRSLSIPARYRARLRAIRREEESPTLKARRSDIRIQTKVIDLVRNMIGDAGPKQPDMVDTLLQSFGSHRLFECLASKLKPRPARAGKHPSSGSGIHSSSGGVFTQAPAGKRPTLTTPAAARDTREDREAAAHAARISSFPTHLYPPTEIINNTVFTLIHIANGRPSHRQMLLNLTTPLSPTQSPASLFPSSTFPTRFLPQHAANGTVKVLDLLLPLFSYPDPRIRVACCWIVHNILWMEDASDALEARKRATEMRNRGFEEAVRSCCNDEHLDVSQRAKGDVAMFEGGSASGAGSANRDVGRGESTSTRAAMLAREREAREEVEGRSEHWTRGIGR